MSINFANAERERLDRDARRQALEAGARNGEPKVTAFDLEVARRYFVSALEYANLVADKRAEPSLSLDQRAARVRQIIESSELDRIQYEHKRTLFQAQQQNAAEKSSRRLANVNVVLAFFVMLAIIAQALVAYWQYEHDASAPTRALTTGE